MTNQEYGYDIADMHFFKDQEMTMEMQFEDLPEGAFEKIMGGVPIIRCKDCAWHTKKHCAQFGLIGFDDDDYCSYAERKKK